MPYKKGYKRNYKAESLRRKELEALNPDLAKRRKASALKSFYKWKVNNPEDYRVKVVETQPQRNEAARRYRQTAKGKDKNRDTYLKTNYGISLDDYNKMFAEQDGLCFVCRRPESRRTSKGEIMALDVDHNHQTDEVRKLLCHSCNVSIGFLDENPDRMRKLAEYIESFQRVLDRGKQ